MATLLSKLKAVSHEATFPVLMALCAVHCFNDLLQSVVSAVYPMLKDDLHLTFGQIGIVTLVYQIAASVFQPVVGYTFDRRPYVGSLPMGMVFTAAGIILFAYSMSLTAVLIAVFLVGIIRASRVPFRYIVKGLKPIVMLLMITVVFNLFLQKDGEVLLRIWKLSVTTVGLRNAVYMAVRLIYLIIGSALMTFTTTPKELTDGIEALLHPLNKVHVPVHEVSMMMSIALRFIPILLEETDKIMKAQQARGADFESGNMIQRAKSMIPILVPLFVSAFRRAYDLAMAMEARCYRGGEGRTKMKPLKYQSRDRTAYVTMVVYVALVVAIGRFVPLKVWIF